MIGWSPWTALLTVMVVVSAVVTAGISYYYIRLKREQEGIGRVLLQVNRNQQTIQGLANDALRYYQRHPEIEDALRRLEVLPEL